MMASSSDPTPMDTEKTNKTFNPGIKTHTSVPLQEKATPEAYIKIHVCQASYGDCLALEIDPSPPNNYPLIPRKNWNTHVNEKGEFSEPEWGFSGAGGTLALEKQAKSPSRRVIVVDGGPGNQYLTGTTFESTTSLQNFYIMLNRLIPEDSDDRLDTLVVTHDDMDHIGGIKQFLVSLNDRGAKQPADIETIREFQWQRGIKLVKKKISPIGNLWHNSAGNVIEYVKNKEGKLERPGNQWSGYFDAGKASLAAKGILLPGFNQEFPTPKLPIIHKYARTASSTPVTYRGHAEFEFLSPNEDQLTTVSTFYSKYKKGKISKKTGKPSVKNGIPLALADSAVPVDMEKVANKPVKAWEDFQRLLAENVKITAVDKTEKNNSSIAFIVKAEGTTPSVGSKAATSRSYTALMTGDANAANTFLPIFLKGGGLPLQYDVMKVMHHGSKANNFFNRQEMKVSTKLSPFMVAFQKILPKKLMLVHGDKEKNKTLALQYKVIDFFSSVRAKKYIISAGPEEHANPHLSTLVGIIARAVMHPEPDGIDIYLTNPLHNAVWQLLSEWWFQLDAARGLPEYPLLPPRDSKLDSLEHPNIDVAKELEEHQGKESKMEIDDDDKRAKRKKRTSDMDYDYMGDFYRIWWLKPKQAYGTVNLTYSNRVLDRNDWERVVPDSEAYQKVLADLYAGFKNHIGRFKPIFITKRARSNFGVVTLSQDDLLKLKRKAVEDNIREFHQKKVKEAQEMEAQATVISSAITGIAPSGGVVGTTIVASSVPPSVQGPAGIEMLMDNAPSTSQVIIPATLPQVPPLKIPWATLVKFGLAVGDLELFATSLMPSLKTLQSMDELLEYLVFSQALTAAEVILVKHAGIIDGKWTAGSLLSIFLSAKSVAIFMKSLPYEFITTANILNDKLQNPLLWQVSDFFQAAVVNFHAAGNIIQQGAGIPQVFFILNRPEGSEPMRWQVPGRPEYFGTAPMIVQLDSGIHVTLYWPGDQKCQIIHASFRGHLPNSSNRKVRCEYMILPTQNAPIRYYFEFVDENYSNEDFSLPLLDLVQTFAGVGFSVLTSFFANFSLPGLPSLDSLLDETLVVSQPGFMLQRGGANTADICLQRIFGTFVFKDVEDWSPFGDIVTFKLPKVKLTINDVAFPTSRRLLFHIYQSVNFSGQLIPLEFESRAELDGAIIYRLSFVPDESQPFSMLTLMDWLQISDYKSGLPDFFTNVMEAITLRRFTLGWRGSTGVASPKSFSPVPSVVELVSDIDSLTIITEILELTDMRVFLRITDPGDAVVRAIFVDVRGTMDIADNMVDVHLSFGKNQMISSVADPTSLTADIVLDFKCAGSSLTLQDLFKKYLPDTKLLPSPFDTLVENLGLDKLLLTITKGDTGKYELSMLLVELSLDDVDINMFAGISLEDPRMIIRVVYPLDKALRDIQATVDCFVDIAGYGVNASLVLAVGVNDGFALSITPEGASLPVFAVIEHFSTELGANLDFQLPSEYGPLTSINLGSLYVAFGRNHQGKLSPSDIALVVTSDINLQLWDSPSVELSKLSITYRYTLEGGSDVTFYCVVDIEETLLDTTISYDGPGKTSALTAPNPSVADPVKPVGTQKVNTQGSWAVTCTYQDTISFFNIMKRLSGIDLQQTLAGNDLTVLRELLDIKISNVTLNLTKQPDLARVYLEAKTDWLDIFKSVQILVGKSALGLSFSFSVSLANNLLSLFPGDFAAILSEYLRVDNTIIAVFVGELDATVFPPLNGIVPRPQWAGNGRGGGVAMSTRVRIDGTTKLKVIGMLLKAADLTVVGVIKNDVIAVSVQVASISLLQDKLKIAGSFVILSDPVTRLFIGIRGTFAWDLGKEVTTDIIAGAIDFGLDISNPALIGLSFRVAVPGPLRNLFGVKGLQVQNFLVQASFPPAQEFIPSLLSLSGALRIESLNDVSGSIDFLWVENNPQNCYAAGSILNLNIPKLLATFAREATIPSQVVKAIEGNGINLKTLAFEFVPHDMVTSLGISRKQKIYFEGNMSLGLGGRNVWAGYALIDVQLTNFQILGMMSPLTIGTKDFFSITRNPEMSWGWEKYTGGKNEPPIPKGKDVDPKMLRDGPILQISSQNRDAPIYISGQVTVLGQKRSLLISVTDTGLQFAIGAGLLAYDLSLNSVLSYASGLSTTASMNFKPDPITLPAMEFPHRFGGLTIPSKTLAGNTLWAMMSASYGVAWDTRSGTFWLKMSGTMSALGMNWAVRELHLRDTVTAADFENVYKMGLRFCTEFAAQFRTLFLNWLSQFRNDFNTVITFLRNNWNLGYTELVRAIGSIFNIDDWRPIVNSVVRFFQPGLDAAVRIMKDLALSAESVGRMAREVFNVALKKAQQVINKLRQYGYQAEATMASLRDVFAYSDIKITMTEMLNGGFREKEIAAAAKIVFNASSKVIQSWGREIGMAFEDLGKMITELF